MYLLTKKFKSVSALMMSLAFLFAISLTACSGGQSTEGDDSSDEATEEVMEVEEEAESEHPSGGEHPSGDEEGGEHPSGDEEHPSDSTESEM